MRVQTIATNPASVAGIRTGAFRFILFDFAFHGKNSPQLAKEWIRLANEWIRLANEWIRLAKEWIRLAKEWMRHGRLDVTQTMGIVDEKLFVVNLLQIMRSFVRIPLSMTQI